ncbi:hypothetical protein [Natrinema versiforme]|uniref:Uncharacterized protein n=1 Tax=Natrinema versiforme JCM 10478 TaxID=1227496 RepID=L9XQY4_9EURY|nr:hypothetical protein [Natrinema versiforme]ELY63942.1 hypothetical protein C489_17882 [Natrinema versiforme JCM 10478]
MSVIRQPEVLGRTTRRRVVGVTAALSAAAIETLAVGLWFGLVVGSRTSATALAGLGILFCGALLRTGVVGATISDLGDLLEPHRLGAAVVLTGGWVVWLLTAEQVGGGAGVAVATGLLAAILAGQFVLERYAFRPASNDGSIVAPILSGVVMAAGASALLATAWFTDWALSSAPIALGFTTVVVRIEALHVGAIIFAVFAFLAHQRRFQRLLDP